MAATGVGPGHAVGAVGATLSGRSTAHRISWGLPPRYVAWFFLWTSGIHVGIVAADPSFYRHFADGALVPGLASAWRSGFMAHAGPAGLVVAAGEAALALLLLGSRACRRVGWLGVVTFHAALLCFGWGFWVWTVPVAAILVLSAMHDWSGREPDGPRSHRQMTLVDHSR